PTAVNAKNPDAEDPYGDKNPYSFHTYADNPDKDALPPSITPDPPAAEKTLTPQGDGSYELSLSVTADAGENAMPDASAEVVLVVDVSGSMDKPEVRPAIAQEREVLLQIGEMLQEKQVPFHVILFSTGAWTDGKTYTAQNYGEFVEMVNGLTTRLGIKATCWEAALHLAGKVLKQIDDAEVKSTEDDVNYKDKYVMFISDGKPNRRVHDTGVNNPYQITYFSQSFGGKSVPGWGYAEGQSSGGSSGAEIEMRPLLLEQKLVAAGANVINVFIQSDETDGKGPMWMKRMSNIAYAGGIYTQEPPAGTYYWADAANDGEIAGELISATRFILRKFLYQDVSLTDGLTKGTALAGTTELAPEGAVPDFSYTITLKNGTEYIGEFPAGETTALRFCRNTDDGIKYLAADGSETANAEEALLLGKAEYKDSTRTVNWDIKPPNAVDGAHYTLIEDATYTVSFPVWPTQETYDAISGRENGSDTALTEGLASLEEFDYSFLRSHPPTSLSSLFELLDILPADVQQVVSGDPAGISVSEEEGNWTMTVAQNLDHPVVLTITTKATAEQDSRAIVVRATGVGGVSHAASALQTYTYSFPFAAPPPTLSNLFELLRIDASDVTEAVSSDPEGMVLKREGTNWKLNLSESCDHALLTLTKRGGSVIAVYVTDSGEAEAAVTSGFPSDVQRYDYPFSFKQAPTSLSRLFALLELLPETVDGIVSSDPANLAVTHAAPGKWKLQVAEGLTEAAVLTITKKNGDIIAVYVTDTEDALKSGTFHFEEYDYTFPSDHPPTSLSGLFALLGISPADVKWVMSGDPDGISVTADVNTPGKWNVDVAENLAQPTLLTLIMQDDSVFAIHASPVEASQRIAPREYTYTFPRTPALTSPSNLFELLQISQEDVYMLVSDDPDRILVSKAATGDWTLHVAENLDRPVLLTITKQNGELIAVHATPSDAVSAGSIAEPVSPWVLREYRSPFDAAPTLLSELFALTKITEANAVKVVSSDPAGISVTGEPGNWSLQVMPGLDHGVLLTITMDGGSVIPVYVTDSEESATRITSRSWGLSTNTKGTAVNYTPRLQIQKNGEPPKWRNFPSGREEIENPAPVELAAWTVYARKLWLDSGTEHSAIQSLTLHLHQVSGEHDNADYIGAVTLTGRDGWLSADFSISPGMMVEKTAETASWGKAVTFDGAPYVLLNEGYGYYFTEELPDSAGDLFQLEEDVFYPMLVDGVPVNATRVGDAYTDVGRLVKPLQVKNRLNGIEITKQVVDSAGKAVSPRDTVTTDEATGQAEPVLFPVKVTLMAPEGGDLSGFPRLDKNDPDSFRIVRYSVYDWEWNSLKNNYLVFNGGVAEDVIDLPNGGTIFFPSVPEGTRYAVEEPETSMPEGYSFQDAAYLIRDPDTHQYRNADSVTVEADGKTVTRYLAIVGENRVNVINRLIGEIGKEPVLPRIVIDKFQTGDNSQKLSGAAFVLYRYPSAEELEDDETLDAETPLYYCRPDPDEPPTFTPDKEQALTVITDADGRAEFTDLPDGVYYLLETEAPIDYHRLIAPIAVTVDTSWLETAENPTQAQIAAASVFTVHIANTPKTTLPATGGPGPARQAGLAPLLLGVGAAGLVILRRKRKTAGR
ncbi:MAG: VWA domain-containing protein, partial [Oscillospiraceae bacterium]|nr:VWA domain-containing protein [Oscillospiraceae bacterium]